MVDPIIAHTFAELSRLVHARPGQQAVMQAVVDAAPTLVPGCDHASIMLARRGRFETGASSDEVGALVDRLERETGEGPCVDAITSDAYTLTPDVEAACDWPALAERVLAETPVRGMAGYRLLVDDRKAGALNLFSDRAGAFDEAAADAGTLLAAFATTALSGASDHERAETTARGLHSNREIGTAVGLLMSAHQVSSEQAFDVLRRTSSELNVKVVELARRVVADAETSR